MYLSDMDVVLEVIFAMHPLTGSVGERKRQDVFKAL